MTDHSTEDDRPGRLAASDAASISVEFDEGERPSVAVVRAVTALTNTPVLDLEPLYDVVDPDHLDGLFGRSGRTLDGSAISFEFNGCRVTVRQDGVTVEADGRRAG